MTKEQIRKEILTNLKANNVYISGDFWFMLISNGQRNKYQSLLKNNC